MLKFIYRFIKDFLIWLLCTLPLELLGLLILSVVLLFTKKEAVQLPTVFGLHVFKWWDNYESYVLSHDHEFLDGLAGPDYYLERENIDLVNYWPRYFARLNWLGVRNPLNYFQYKVIGVVMDTRHVLVVQKPQFVDIDESGGSIHAQTLSGTHYEYYYVIPYKFWKGRALRLRWGHKITSSYRLRQQFVFVINPFFTLG